MKFAYTKEALVLAWVLAIAVLGLAVQATSVPSWLMLTGLALVPALVFLRFWGQRSQTLSETIQEARR